MSAQAWVGAASQLVTAIVAILAATFAWWQVREARRTREAQTQPFVVVDIQPGRTWMNGLTLVIENVGRTLAKDVKIAFDPPLTTTMSENKLADSVLVRGGIAALPPGRRIEALFDLSHDRLKQGLPMRYEVTVTFRDYRGKSQEPLPCTIDLSYLFDLEVMSERTMRDLVGEVKALRSELEKWPDRGLKVRRPKDDRRAREDREWQYALTGTRRGLGHPGMVAGFGWPARLAIVRALALAWRRRINARGQSRKNA